MTTFTQTLNSQSKPANTFESAQVKQTAEKYAKELFSRAAGIGSSTRIR